MILYNTISKEHFKNCAHKNFGAYMVKLVVDLDKEIIAYDAEWHADLEAELLENGSVQKDLWGFNYYPDEDMLEYNSLINIRPLENKSTDILDTEICSKVEQIFRTRVKNE